MSMNQQGVISPDVSKKGINPKEPLTHPKDLRAKAVKRRTAIAVAVAMVVAISAITPRFQTTELQSSERSEVPPPGDRVTSMHPKTGGKPGKHAGIEAATDHTNLMITHKQMDARLITVPLDMDSATDSDGKIPRLYSGGDTSSAETAAGRKLYVSVHGTDAADGSKGHPYGSIPFAVAQLRAGDTLFITEGEYAQPAGGAIFTHSGTPEAPIAVQGVGRVVIHGTESIDIGGYAVASNYEPAFDTGGQSHIELGGFSVTNLRAAVKVTWPSEYIDINNLSAAESHFGILIDGASNVNVRDVQITNCRDGIRTDATEGIVPKNLLFENVDVSASKNIYPGWETAYRNGDGFILEHGTNIVVRNSRSYDNWDSGFDIKATNVTLERVDIFSNYHQGIKVWGDGVVLRDSLVRDTRSMDGDPVAVEGWGVNNRGGSIMFINTTFSNNHSSDIRTDNQVGIPMTLLVNCIIARNLSVGKLWQASFGTLTEANNIWFDSNEGSPGFSLAASSAFIDPKFKNWNAGDFHLEYDSPAIDFGAACYLIGPDDFRGSTRKVGASVDAGAFEFAG